MLHIRNYWYVARFACRWVKTMNQMSCCYMCTCLCVASIYTHWWRCNSRTRRLQTQVPSGCVTSKCLLKPLEMSSKTTPVCHFCSVNSWSRFVVSFLLLCSPSWSFPFCHYVLPVCHFLSVITCSPFVISVLSLRAPGLSFLFCYYVLFTQQT